jgi:hypothetical protein
MRDGHYPIWGPLHLLYKINEAGDPQNGSIRSQLVDMVGCLAGSKALPNDVSLLDVYAQSGLIPECAMRVARTDGGALTTIVPATPCVCLFEKKATGSTFYPLISGRLRSSLGQVTGSELRKGRSIGSCPSTAQPQSTRANTSVHGESDPNPFA